MKKAYTLVELAVVISVIMVLSAVVLVGMGSARRDEGFRADYLQFYEDLKSLELRSNLGQLAPTTGTMPTPTARQVLSFVIGNPSGTYTVNGTSVRTLKNGTTITMVNAYTDGTALFSFVPHPANSAYVGPTPQAGSFAAYRAPSATLVVPIASPVSITFTGRSGITKIITVIGSSYYISGINIQ